MKRVLCLPSIHGLVSAILYASYVFLLLVIIYIYKHTHICITDCGDCVFHYNNNDFFEQKENKRIGYLFTAHRLLLLLRRYYAAG